MLELAECHAHQLRDPPAAVDQRHPLGDAAIVLDRLEVGMDVRPLGRLSAGQTQDGDRVRVSLRDTAEGVLRARARLHREHADRVAILDAAEPIGHVHAGPLLPGQNRPDVLSRAGVDQRLRRERRYPLDTLFLQYLRYCLVSVQW